MPAGVVGDGDGRDPRVRDELARHPAEALPGLVLERPGPRHQLHERGATVVPGKGIGEGDHAPDGRRVKRLTRMPAGTLLTRPLSQATSARHPYHRDDRISLARLAGIGEMLGGTGASMLHDPSHYEPPPIAHEIVLSQRDRDVLRELAGRAGRIRRPAGPCREGTTLAAAQRPSLGAPDGLDQRDPVARDERRRRAHAADRGPLGPGPGARPAAHALPVATPARRT